MSRRDKEGLRNRRKKRKKRKMSDFFVCFFFFVYFVIPLYLHPQLPEKDPGASLRRASALFDQRKFSEAAEEAQKAIDSNPALIGAWKLRGLSLQLAGRIPEAESLFASALQRFQQDADLWFYYARVQYLQSSLRPAEKAARQALELQPDHAGAHTQLAIVLEALNDYTNALQHYRLSIEIDAKQSRPPTLPL